MDGHRFDDFSRAMTRGLSRRRAIRAAAALLGRMAVAGADDATARPALCRPAGRYCTSN